MRGLDVDNDSAFINDTLVGYCRDNKIELTRCRAYKKNDQAWIEQKNGAVVRRMVGYGRLEGAQTAAVLNQLFASARLFVNFFQPSFKLISKTRDGAKVTKKYHLPATPCERLLAREDVSDECKEQLRRTLASLDPVRLLSEIREAQRTLAQLEVGVANAEAAQATRELSGFVASLSTAWRDGEVRPTHRKRSEWPAHLSHSLGPIRSSLAAGSSSGSTNSRTPTPKISSFVCRRARQSAFQCGQLRTLQRRVKQWRSEIARQLVLGLNTSPRKKRNVPCGAVVAIERCADDRLAGFQIDQAQR